MNETPNTTAGCGKTGCKTFLPIVASLGGRLYGNDTGIIDPALSSTPTGKNKTLP